MTYALIGTGNMAWLIASRMLSAGHTCSGVWGRNDAAADELCAAFSLPRYTALSQHHDGLDACIIAVTDSSIGEVVRALSLRTTTLIHTAGSIPLTALSRASVHAGVVWPVYSIRKADLPTHRNFPALVEANTRQAADTVRAIARAICDTIYEAPTAQRQALHLAAVMGNNFVNHLIGTATDICASEGLPISLLQPLLEQTITGTRTRHPAELQTGPARRHDESTIALHLALLDGHPQWQELYVALTKAIMERFPLPPKG